MGGKKISKKEESEKAELAGMLGVERLDDSNAKRLSKEEMDLIVTEHQVHGNKLAWGFLKGWQVRMSPDEVTSIVGMALVEAATRFDPSRGVAFKTFFFYHLRGMLLREITRLVNQSKIKMHIPTSVDSVVRKKTEDSKDTNLSLYLGVDNKTPEMIAQENQVSSICNAALKKLDDLEKMVIQRHYIEDEPLKEIAKDLGYNRCHMSRVKSKALAKLHVFISETMPISSISDELDDKGTKHNISDVVKKSYTGGRGRRKVKPKKKN